LVFANVFPVAIISLGGLESEATVWQAVVALGAGPGVPVAIAAGMIAIGIPALQVLTLLWILSFAVAGRSCPYFVLAVRLLRASKPWGMIEVCLLAILVALVKLSGFLHVVAGIGIAATVVLAPLRAVITNCTAADRIRPCPGPHGGQDPRQLQGCGCWHGVCGVPEQRPLRGRRDGGFHAGRARSVER
jgi:uncharacterized paraquat-inducible protein A